jgi:acetyltransferase
MEVNGRERVARVGLLGLEEFDAAVSGLADVLVDSVDDGASVGFLSPLSHEHAVHWWSDLLRAPGIRTWVALDEQDSIVGCVILSTASPDNAQHRAEVSKLLVLRRVRGLGVATDLMEHVEADARRLGRTLLLLDTEADSPAETLYLRRGWLVYGTITNHARVPDGRLADTTFMVRHLD